MKRGAAARRVAIALAVAALVAVAFHPALRWLGLRWTAADGYFSHGPLVPLACLWLAWRRRAELAAALARTPAPGTWWGLALIVPALLLGAAAAYLRFDGPAALALFALLLPGLALLFGGVACLRVLAFPCAFLLFAWPLPMFAVTGAIGVLKRLVVGGSTALVNLFGAGVRAEGSFLVLPGGARLLVDDECSGLKSALALVALGAFMAGTARGLAPVARCVHFALALPVALFANVVRVTLLAALGRLGGAGLAARLHDPSTWGVYVVALAAYVLLERLLRGRGTPSPPTHANSGATG